MSDKELYQQKKKAQLDEWKADVDKFRAKASGASADAQLEIGKQLRALESKIDEGRATLSELAKASEGAWESLKEDVESAWGSLKSAVGDVAAKLK